MKRSAATIKSSSPTHPPFWPWLSQWLRYYRPLCSVTWSHGFSNGWALVSGPIKTLELGEVKAEANAMMMVMVTEAEYGGGSLKLALTYYIHRVLYEKNDIMWQAYFSYYVNQIEISNQSVDRYLCCFGFRQDQLCFHVSRTLKSRKSRGSATWKWPRGDRWAAHQGFLWIFLSSRAEKPLNDQLLTLSFQ